MVTLMPNTKLSGSFLPELTDKSIVDSIFYSLPDMWRFHDRREPVYRYLGEKISSYFSSAIGTEVSFGPIHDLVWPRVPLGNIDSYSFFVIDEILLYTFYYKNFGRYKTFFDVGAHIGIDAIVAAKIGYQVTCFEPDANNFQMLRDLADRNQCHSINAINKGISNSEGTVDFIQVQGNTTANHIVGVRDFYGDFQRTTIETTTFDAVGPFPDLMKINVEAHEKVIVPLIPMKVWRTTDCFIEVHDHQNRQCLFEHFKDTEVNIFSQKIGWKKVTQIDDMPLSNKEGYIFISSKPVMPW